MNICDQLVGKISPARANPADKSIVGLTLPSPFLRTWSEKMSERCEHEDEQLEILRGTHGLYVGLLSPEELKALNHLCEKGLARRSYEGVGGFIGLAKVDLKVSEDFRGLTGTPLNEDPTPSAGIFGARTR